MCDEEEFNLEDHEDEFRDYFCNSFRCSAVGNTSAVQEALEEYVRELHKELYVFQEVNKTVEDIYNDLDYILRMYGQ